MRGELREVAITILLVGGLGVLLLVAAPVLYDMWIGH